MYNTRRSKNYYQHIYEILPSLSQTLYKCIRNKMYNTMSCIPLTKTQQISEGKFLATGNIILHSKRMLLMPKLVTNHLHRNPYDNPALTLKPL